MRWPWSAPRGVESRASSSFTDYQVGIAEAAAAGTGARAASTAALEASAGVVARGLAAATVERAPAAVADALTPAVLALIGRSLIRRGESLFLIDVERGTLRLAPAGSWDVAGGWDEAAWRYRLDLFGPSGNETRLVPAAAVVHVRYSVDPSRPWCGIGPLSWAALSADLHAGATAALAADMRASTATVIPMPGGDVADDEADDPLAPLKSALVSAKGKSVFVETTAGSFGGDSRDAPKQDWLQKRLGPNPPETLGSVHDASAVAVLAACGVDPVLAGLAKSDGTAARESYRKFERLTLQPMARLIETELRFKLDAPDLTLSFDSLRASDFAGIARSFKGLVEGGLTKEQAARLLDLPL